MRLNELGPAQPRQDRKRVGRGVGSGVGKTSGRGHKGAKSRSGARIKGFEGGQMPITRRLPKRGFCNIHARRWSAVSLHVIARALATGRLSAEQPIDAAALRSAGLVKNARDGIRLIGDLAPSAALHFVVHGCSRGARRLVEAAGGSVTLLLSTIQDDKGIESGQSQESL